MLDERLNFKAHMEYIISKAKSRLAWIKRFAREFEDPWTIKRLFFAFILPIVEYGSQIWNPYYENMTARIESIQKQFLLFALRRLKWQDRFRLPTYEHRLLLLQMVTLRERRLIAQITFIFNVIRGKLSSKIIMSRINFRTSHHRARDSNLLEISVQSLNYLKYEPVNFMLSTFNSFYHKKLPNCDKFIIDFNFSNDTVKLRLNDYFRCNSS